MVEGEEGTEVVDAIAIGMPNVPEGRGSVEEVIAVVDAITGEAVFGVDVVDF